MSTTEEQALESLPVNDPESGYKTHDTSPVYKTGTLPDVEQEIYDERTQAEADANKAIAEHEDKTVKQRRDDSGAADEAQQEASSTTQSSKTSKSSSSAGTTS